MKKYRNYSFYVILGLPAAISIILTNGFELSAQINIVVVFIMTIYSMNAYFKPDKNNKIASLFSSFFLSFAFVLLSTFYLSLPLWLITLGFR